MKVSTLILCWIVTFVSAFAFITICWRIPWPMGGLLGGLLLMATYQTLGMILKRN